MTVVDGVQHPEFASDMARRAYDVLPEPFEVTVHAIPRVAMRVRSQFDGPRFESSTGEENDSAEVMFHTEPTTPGGTNYFGTFRLNANPFDKRRLADPFGNDVDRVESCNVAVYLQNGRDGTSPFEGQDQFPLGNLADVETSKAAMDMVTELVARSGHNCVQVTTDDPGLAMLIASTVPASVRFQVDGSVGTSRTRLLDPVRTKARDEVYAAFDNRSAVDLAIALENFAHAALGADGTPVERTGFFTLTYAIPAERPAVV